MNKKHPTINRLQTACKAQFEASVERNSVHTTHFMGFDINLMSYI